MLNYEKKHLSLLRTVSQSKVSSSLMLKRRSSSSRTNLSHIPRSSWHQLHSPGRLSSSEYDISYIHNSKIKLVQLNICTKKPKLDHYYSSRVDYRSVEMSFNYFLRKSRPLDIFPTYSSTSHARIHRKIRHDLC